MLIWGASTDGKYSTKSGYHWLTQGSVPHPTNAPSWTWVWKLHIPETMKFFVWMVLHNSLPTNQLRQTRHLTIDASCQRCGNGIESTLHALRDCSSISHIWRTLAFTAKHDFFINDLLQWFSSFAADDSGQLFLTSCWNIWKTRNNEVFNDIKWPAWQLSNTIASEFLLLRTALPHSHQPRQARLVAWISPADPFIKLNTNGSSFGNLGNSGFGGVLRDSNGSWILGFSGYCGVTTSINAELLAIAKGLSLGWNNGFKKVVCESDCKAALHLIEVGVPYTHPYAPLIGHICDLKDFDWTISFTHTLREGNFCAGWLAKYGVTSNCALKLWHQCSPEVSIMLLGDSMGVEHSKV